MRILLKGIKSTCLERKKENEAKTSNCRAWQTETKTTDQTTKSGSIWWSQASENEKYAKRKHQESMGGKGYGEKKAEKQ